MKISNSSVLILHSVNAMKEDFLSNLDYYKNFNNGETCL